MPRTQLFSHTKGISRLLKKVGPQQLGNRSISMKTMEGRSESLDRHRKWWQDFIPRPTWQLEDYHQQSSVQKKLSKLIIRSPNSSRYHCSKVPGLASSMEFNPNSWMLNNYAPYNMHVYLSTQLSSFNNNLERWPCRHRHRDSRLWPFYALTHKRYKHTLANFIAVPCLVPYRFPQKFVWTLRFCRAMTWLPTKRISS